MMPREGLDMKNKRPFGPYGAEPPKIPLPNDLPKKADVSNLPENLLRSRTIDSLTTQNEDLHARLNICLLYTSPSPRDATLSRMPSSA